ncbi:FecR family protein [uncultured Alistipes sp.]|uniref:FecR family protein n=1 Tax=uncultured Alistipes sp. TaxID=538949 RepID=UPI002665D825|nr:FecR family protein [uncultured Alistipes sp.]
MMQNEISDTLLFKFFLGETTNEETDRIAAWLDENPEEHQQRMKKAHELFVNSIMGEPDLVPEADRRIGSRLLHSRPVRRVVGLAAALLVAVGASYLFFDARMERLAGAPTSIEAPAGQHVRMALSDGTVVELNSKSRIVYPALFTGRERRVRLEGEAMFDVRHDEEHPFVVETYACDVEVRGTHFNVIADKNTQEFSTALFEGSVAVRNKINDEEILMEPNTIVNLKNGHLHLSELESRDNYLWTDGIISFSGDNFEQIVDKLRRYFDVDIEIQRTRLPDVRYKRLKIRTSEGLDHILRILQRSSDFTYEYNDLENKIIIK